MTFSMTHDNCKFNCTKPSANNLSDSFFFQFQKRTEGNIIIEWFWKVQFRLFSIFFFFFCIRETHSFLRIYDRWSLECTSYAHFKSEIQEKFNHCSIALQSKVLMKSIKHGNYNESQKKQAKQIHTHTFSILVWLSACLHL